MGVVSSWVELRSNIVRKVCGEDERNQKLLCLFYLMKHDFMAGVVFRFVVCWDAWTAVVRLGCGKCRKEM